MTPQERVTAALVAHLATPMGGMLQRKGAVGLSALLGISKQTLSAATTGTDPLSYRVARRLAKLLGLPMGQKVEFLALHVRAMHRPMLDVSDLDEHALALVVESIERHRARKDELAAKRKGKPS